jgi:hypothetical protein
MSKQGIKLSRISKLLVDTDELSVGEAQTRRERFAVMLPCGGDVARSRTLQVAFLIAASIASRCFPGADKVVLGRRVVDSDIRLRPLIQGSLVAALKEIVGRQNVRVSDGSETVGTVLLFGDAITLPGALRVTYDRWIAQVRARRNCCSPPGAAFLCARRCARGCPGCL